MRIALDMNVLLTSAALRGMGRYTQQQFRELLAFEKDHQYFLISAAPIPEENRLFDWSKQPNVSSVPVVVDDVALSLATPPSFDETLKYSGRLEQILKSLKIDVYHNTCPFIFPYYSSVRSCAVTTTFYDAIPLIFPGDYFQDPTQRLHYRRCLDNVFNSSGVVSISQSAARDLRLYTGYPDDRISLVYPLIEAGFQKLPRSKGLEARNSPNLTGLPRKFILSVTGIHRSKNAGMLLESFSEARGHLNKEMHLVILLPGAFEKNLFHQRYGNPPQVVTLAGVTESELCGLYNLAEFVVQPSIYEGFGYPVAEAMSCGAAVITTTSSSLPEIAGDAAILVDPANVTELTDAILKLAREPELRSRLKDEALRRSRLFTDGRAMARNLENAYRISAEHFNGTQKRARVAVWSSMPPLDCGVADYSSELVAEYSKTHDVDVYVDASYHPTPIEAEGVAFHHPADFEMSKRPEQNIFQVGARNYQEFMYAPLRKYGGVAVLHDLSMSLGFFYLAKSKRRLAEFERDVVAFESDDVIEEYRRIQIPFLEGTEKPLVSFFDRYKLLRWIISSSAKVFTHTKALSNELLKDYPDTSVATVRMGVRDQIPKLRHAPLRVWRLLLGLGAETMCVGCFGIVDRSKRIGQVISSFEDLCDRHPGSLLIIVGRAYDIQYKAEVENQIALSDVKDRIVMLDYVSSDVLFMLMSLCDVIVNLRWPTRLGLSAILMRALALGKPVLCSEIAEWGEISEAGCLRIPTDERESDVMTAHLLRLAADKSERDRLSAAARRWFLSNGTLSRMASDYQVNMPIHGKVD